MRISRGLVARAAAVGLLALGGIAAGTSGASAGTGVAKSCSGTGAVASCEAEAVLSNPASMSLTITATPNQTVVEAYDTECWQGGSKGKSDETSFIGTTPLTLTIKHAYAHPSTCVVAVDAQLLNKGGKGIHVVINSPAVAAPAVVGSAGGCVNDLGDSSANGTPIVLWGCNGQGQQDWTYTKDKLVHGGRCLTDPGNGGPGTGLVLNGCSSAPGDLWAHRSNGEYFLSIPGGQLCLTAPPGTKKGTQLVASVCQNTKNQRWTLP